MPYNSSPILAAATSPPYLARQCVNIIELTKFKERAGVRWPKFSESVYARLEALLRARLGSSDLFIRISDSAYLVTMPATAPGDVNTTCIGICFELYTSFFGQCDISQIEVNTVMGSQDDTLILQKLTIETIANIAARRGFRFSPHQDADQAATPKPENHGLAAEIATKIVTTSQSPIGTSPLALTVEHQFIPIWSVRNAAVTTYVCEPKTIFSAGRQAPLLIQHLTPKERIQIDIDIFKAGNMQLAKSHAAGNRFLLAAVISFELLGTPTGRMEFLAACRNLSRDFRNFLSFIICDIPPGVAQSRLASMVTILQPFGRGISATIAPKQRTYTSYQGIGLQSIGFNLREFTPQNPLTQSDTEQLAQFARRANLGTFLSGVQDRTVLKYAQDANIAHLSGPAIAAAVAEPVGMWRLTWTDTLARPDMEIWD
jgi:hypothetical protein